MTSLVANETKDVALYSAPEGGWASDGNDDAPIHYPLIKMVHATSRMTDDAPKHAGEFWHDDLERFTETLEIVGLVRKDSRALFMEGSESPVCRSSDGKTPEPGGEIWGMEMVQLRKAAQPQMLPHAEPSSCASCVFGQWFDKTPPPCKSSIVLLVDRPGIGPARMQLSGKSIRPYNDLIGRIRGKKHRLFFYKLTLSTVRKSEGGNTWYELAPIKAELLPVEEMHRYNEIVRELTPAFDAVAHVDEDEIPSAFMAELSEFMNLNGLHANHFAKFMKANFTEVNLQTFMGQNGFDTIEEFVMEVRKHEGPDTELPFE